MTHIIDSLNWRYATKKYDSSKIIPTEQLDMLVESVRLSPSSFGLQPYTIINVKNKDIRQQLQAAAWNQSQITEASDLIVFAVPTGLDDTSIDAFVQNISKTRNVTVDSLVEYANMMKGSVNSRTPEERVIWSAKQAYIAMGILLTVAADQKIDATPMEGFDCAKFDEILGLKEKGLTSVVVTTLGYRSDDDEYAHNLKVRKSKTDIYLEM
jgi:nitroreductase / dihydropteridine reductase